MLKRNIHSYSSGEAFTVILQKKAFTNEESEWILEEVVPLKKFSNSPEAMRAYQDLHRENPSREI